MPAGAVPDGDGSGEACCKVSRVASARGMAATVRELERQWSASEASLRDLAETFNRQLTGTALRAAGSNPLDGEVENVHRLLTSDEVSRGTYTEVRNRLEREGVDIGRLESHFVSHQTVHNHLRECRAVEAPSDTRSAADRRAAAADTVSALRNRTGAVTRSTLEGLRDRGALDVEGFEVLVEVQVTCETCGRVTTVAALLDAGGCRCTTE